MNEPEVAYEPWLVLRVEPGASADDVEAAHRALCAQEPALSDPAARTRLDTARAAALDPTFRARDRLFGPRSFADLAELAEVLATLPRRPAGPALWLEALAEGRSGRDGEGAKGA